MWVTVVICTIMIVTTRMMTSTTRTMTIPTMTPSPPGSASGRECGLAQDTRSDQESCCSGVNGFKFAYTKHAKLRIEVSRVTQRH